MVGNKTDIAVHIHVFDFLVEKVQYCYGIDTLGLISDLRVSVIADLA